MVLYNFFWPDCKKSHDIHNRQLDENINNAVEITFLTYYNDNLELFDEIILRENNCQLQSIIINLFGIFMSHCLHIEKQFKHPTCQNMFECVNLWITCVLGHVEHVFVRLIVVVYQYNVLHLWSKVWKILSICYIRTLDRHKPRLHYAISWGLDNKDISMWQ